MTSCNPEKSELLVCLKFSAGSSGIPFASRSCHPVTPDKSSNSIWIPLKGFPSYSPSASESPVSIKRVTPA